MRPAARSVRSVSMGTSFWWVVDLEDAHPLNAPAWKLDGDHIAGRGAEQGRADRRLRRQRAGARVGHGAADAVRGDLPGAQVLDVHPAPERDDAGRDSVLEHGGVAEELLEPGDARRGHRRVVLD